MRHKLSMLLLFTFAGMPGISWGAKQNPKSETKKQFYEAKVRIPEGFFQHHRSSLATNLALADPFNQEKGVMVHKRFVNSMFPFVSIVQLIITQKFEEARANFDSESLLERGIKVIERQPKVFGSKGLLLLVRQYAHGTWFRKWIAVFGTASQTNVIVSVFPETRMVQLNSIMRRVVEHAALSDKIITL